MHARKRPPVFCDLDETLIYAEEHDTNQHTRGGRAHRVMNFEVFLRPEGHEILNLVRQGGREVYLFTYAYFGFALEVCKALKLGFDENTIFSFAMILNCRRGLCPSGILIENKPALDPDTQLKMEALGIGPDQVWVVPPYEPPAFESAKLFLAGLPYRLAKLDRSGSNQPGEVRGMKNEK